VQLLRWLLLLPGAMLSGMVGSLAGGIAATLFGQAAIDTAGAFLGTFAFVFAAGFIAPSHRGKVSLGAASLVAVLALGTFVLGVSTTIEEFAELSSRAKVLTPIAQLLGALYAVFLLPPLVTPGTTLDRLWREIVALGTIVAMFGGVVALAGAVVGLLGRGWMGLTVGLGVLLLGAVTWLAPFLHLTLRVNRAQATIERQIQGPEIGRDISWADIVRHVLRVVDFDRAGTTIAENGAIHAASRFNPYGYLLVESPILNQRVRLPIVHRDDFLLAASVFDEPKLMEAVAHEELLVTYAPKHLLPKGLAGGTSHSLHYVITPRGTLQRYYEWEGDAHMAKPAPEKLFGEFVYEGEIKVQVNADPQI
jgi:hypothetical protein